MGSIMIVALVSCFSLSSVMAVATIASAGDNKKD